MVVVGTNKQMKQPLHQWRWSVQKKYHEFLQFIKSTIDKNTNITQNIKREYKT